MGRRARIGKVSKPPEITELEDSRDRIEEEVLGLDVTMGHSKGMHVSHRRNELAHNMRGIFFRIFSTFNNAIK